MSFLSSVAQSGFYIPTAVIVTNVSAVTPFVSQWSRCANSVTVSGTINIDPIANGLCEIDMTVPLATDFLLVSQLAGVMHDKDNSNEGGSIEAAIVSKKARFQYTANNTNLRHFTFIFSYQVV